MTTTNFDYSAIETGYYDRIYQRQKGAQSKWHWLKFQYISDLLAAHGVAAAGSRLLDIACGPGTFVGSLDERIDATGVDIAQPQVDYAAQHYSAARKQFLRIEPGPLPFPDNSFDAVTVIELIEHLPMDQNIALLAEARRVLKPRTGMLVVSTPNYHSGWPVLEQIVNRFSDLSYADQHITRFHRRRLEELLGQAGFLNAKVHPYQGLAPFGAFLSWGLADLIYGIEKRGPARWYGFLLVGSAVK